MAKFKLKDFAKDISVAIKDAQSSPLRRFVGLEHYDSGEPVITRFTDTSLISSAVKEFKENDILIARRNVYLRRAGIAFFSGLTSGDSIILRIYDDCEEKTGIPKEDAIKILPFILNSNDFWNYANKHADGMNSKRISKDMLYDYEFDLPSLTEQRVIADKLWAAYRLKESYKKLLAATDEMVKSRFIEMFGAEDILHTRWPLFRMDEVFTISSSRRILKSEWKDKGSIPFIRVRDMVQLANKEPLTNEFFVSDEFYNSRPDDEKVKPGDIIVSATSTVGKTYIIKPGDRFYFKDADVLLFRKVKEINEVFFTYGLTMPTVWTQIKEGLGGTTVAHFLISNACKLMQPLPPLELQGQFSDIIQQADKSKFELRKSIEAINQVIKSLINN